ncbi:3-deoxy-7-phosphoheptulonate synthase class II, partial [Isoptericola sp. NPDC055063]
MTTAVDTVAPGSDPEGLDRFRSLEARQQPTWPDADALAAVAGRLSQAAPLVVGGEGGGEARRAALAARVGGVSFFGGGVAEELSPTRPP